MGYLTIESGLPGCFCSSFLSFSCFSSAQSGSHLTYTQTHSLSHAQSHGSATVPVPKHHPHGHIQSPSSSSPLLHYLSSRKSSTCTLTWSLTQALTPARMRALTPVVAQTDGEMVRGDFAGCWSERREGGERES